VPSEKVPSEKGEAIMSTVEEPKEPLTIEEELDLMAGLEEHEYEQKREAFAEKLGFRPHVLDREYKRRRELLLGEKTKSKSGGSTIICKDEEPWDAPVRADLLLTEMSDFVKRFVVFQREPDADIFALWNLGTYCVDSFDILPYFGVTAPKENCGKSTLLEILMEFACRVIGGSSMTGPVVYRMIQLYRPTICLDEMDGINKENNAELLRVFNAGHKKSGAVVYRCSGDDSSTPEAFNCFGPKAFGMIDKPGKTLLSRSIMIDLQRKTKGQHVEKFNLRHLPVGTTEMLLRIRRQCTRWAADRAEELGKHVPNTGTLENRDGDNWTPLLTIGDLAGHGWPERVLDAAKIPVRFETLTDRDLLLQDIANIFFTRDCDRLTSATLTADLLRQHEGHGRWHRFHQDKSPELYVMDVAALLGPFDVAPKLQWFSPVGTTGKLDDSDRVHRRGYALKDLQPLFEKYLDVTKLEKVDISSEPF
jgi:hypothetical protein